MKKLFMILPLVFLLCFTFSCSSAPTYLNLFEGPPRPIDEVAYLREYALLRFCEIDGLIHEEIQTKMNELKGAIHGYAILPGEHTVKIMGTPDKNRTEIGLSGSNANWIDGGVSKIWWDEGRAGLNPQAVFGEWTLKFSADAGQTYFLYYDQKELFRTYKLRAYSVSPYIMNGKTKQKVSSIVEFKKSYKSNGDCK